MQRERMSPRLAKAWAQAAPAQGAGLHVRASGAVTEIMLFDAIGEWGISAGAFAAQMAGVRGDVLLRINSPGGDVFDGMAIYNTLRAHRGRITARVEGIAASAATLIALAAERVEMAEPSMWMVHNAWGLALGNRHDMRETADLLEKIDGQLAATYAGKTGADDDQVRRWMDEETFFTAEEALAARFVDGLYAPPERDEEDQRARRRAQMQNRLRLSASL